MIVPLLALAVALPPQAPAVSAGSNHVVSVINERVGGDFSVRFVMSGPPTTYSASRDGNDIVVRIEGEALPGLRLPTAAGPIRAMALEPGRGFSLRITLVERVPYQIVRESASLRLVLRKAASAVPAATPSGAAAAAAVAATDPTAVPSPSPEPSLPLGPDPVAAETADLYGRLFPSTTDPSSLGRLGALEEAATPDNWYSDTRWLGFQVRPWLSVSYVNAKTTEIQADNITADKYWVIQPNFGVGFSPWSSGQWSVNYTPRFRKALALELPHLTSHFFDARIDQTLTNSLSVYGNYHYSQGVLETDEIDPGREYGIGLNRLVDTTLERFKRNSLGGGVRFDFVEDTQVDVSVGATKVLYGNDPREETGERAFFDYDTRFLNAHVRRSLGETRSLGLLFTVNDAPKQPERKQVEGRGYSYGVNLEGEIVRLTTGRIQLGYRTQKNPNAGLGGQEYRDFVYGAQLVREISEDMSIGLGADRKLYLSAYEDNGFYVTDALRGDFTARVPFEVFFRGNIVYQTNGYETSPQISESTGESTLRKDNLLFWTLSLTRTISDWAFLRFDYTGDHRNSNLDRFDIKSRSLSLQIGLGAFGKAGRQGAPTW